MTEDRTLVANLVPIVDDADLTGFVNQLSQALSSDLNININSQTQGGDNNVPEELGEITDAMEDIQDAIGDSMDLLADADNTELVEAFTSFFDMMEEISDDVSDIARDVAEDSEGDSEEGSGGKFAGLKSVFSKGLGSLKEHLGDSMGAVSKGIGVVGGVVTAGFGVVRMVFDAIQKIIAFGKRVSPFFETVLNMIHNVVNLIFGPIFTAIGIEMIPLLKNLYERVMSLVKTMWEAYEQDGLQGMIRELLVGLPEILLPLIADLWELGATVLDAVVGGVLDAVFGRGTWDTIKDAILIIAKTVHAIYDAIGGILSGMGGVGSFLGGFLGFAEGGAVDPVPGGRMVKVGEGGEREWIVPESKIPSFVQGQAKSTVGGNTIYITVQGYTDTDLTDKIVSAMDQYTDRARLMGGL